MLTGGVSFVFGDPDLHARLIARGAPAIVIESDPVQCGAVETGTTKDLAVTVVNRSTTEAKIIGGGISCGCMTLDSIPATLPARGSLVLHIRLKARADTGPFTHVFSYYLSHSRQSRVVGRITGQVTDGSSRTAVGSILPLNDS
ncbi:MAG: DUF1573 domain-containing protein [Pirellulaceae bacterium]